MSHSQVNTTKKTLTILDIILVIFLIFATIIVNGKMIKDGINGMTDMGWHITWLQHFSQQLKEGIVYPRWLAGTNYGYGSPTFVFYPPLTYYVGSLIKATGIGIENTMIFLYSLALFLSGFNCYLFCRHRWGKIAGFCGALAYMSAPYLAYNLYWVSSLSVAYAIAWIPLGWWLTDKSLESPKWKVGIAIFWTILALTHLPTLLLCSLVWFFYILFLLPNHSVKNIVTTMIFSGLGLGLASFFLVPAITEQEYVNIASMQGVIGDIKNAIFGVGLPLIPRQFDLQVSHVFFHQCLVIIFLGFINFLGFRQQPEVIKGSKYWLIFLVALGLMMSYPSLPIWESSSILQKVQAPWRLLSIFSFASAALYASTVVGVINFKGKLKYILASFLVIILLFNISYVYKLARKFPTFRNPGRANLEHLASVKNALENPYNNQLIDVGEYRPVLNNLQPSPDPLKEQPQISLINGKAEIKVTKWQSYQRLLEAKVITPTTIKIRTYYYPAWHLYIEDKSYPIQQADDGTITFTLEPGTYQKIKLVYQQTPSFKLGLLASFISILILAYFVYKLNLKKISIID